MEPLTLGDLLQGPLAVPHGFTLRAGGVSQAPFDTLNLGASVGDEPDAVARNRRRVAEAFGVPFERVVRLDQTHSATVHRASAAVVGAEGDALISDDPQWLLAVSAADCLPVLLHDPRRGAVAAVHAGWRGVARGVLRSTLQALAEAYGSEPGDLQVWIAPSIAGGCYQVGPEVLEALLRDAAVPPSVATPDPERPDHHRLDVAAAARAQLESMGVPSAAIQRSPICNHCDPRTFSYRRDGPRSGRHWALIRAVG